MLDGIVSVGVDVDWCRTTKQQLLMPCLLSGQVYSSMKTSQIPTLKHKHACGGFFPTLHLSAHLPSVAVKYWKAQFWSTTSQNCTPRPCNTTLPRTQTQRARSQRLIVPPHALPSICLRCVLPLQQQWPCNISIIRLPNITVRVPVPASLFHHHAGPSMSLSIFPTLTHSLTARFTLWHTQHQLHVLSEYTHVLWMHPSSERNKKLWKGFRAVEGCG